MERLLKSEGTQFASPSSSAPASAKTGALKRRLGVWEIVFTVLAYNAPLTVVTGYVPLIVSSGNGIGTPLTFLVSGLLILLFAVGFTAMSKHSPNPGAFYAYITVGSGRPLGLGSAFMAIMAYFFMMISIYCYSGVVYTSFFKNMLGVEALSWWGWSFLLMALVACFGYMRITLSARLLSIALLLEIVLVFLWEGAIATTQGVSAISTEWVSMSAFASGSIGVAVLLGVSSFAGFEATAIFREEAKNPETTIPRATYIAVAILALVFCTAAVFFISGFGADQVIAVTTADPSNATLLSIQQYLGKAGSDAVNVLLCTSVFACLLALHNILSRYLYSLGMDGVLPSRLSEVHPKHHSPYRASVVVTVAAATVLGLCALLNIDPFKGYGALGGVGGYALMLLQVLTSISIVRYFLRTPHTYSRWRTLVAPALASVALACTAWLATTNMEFLTGDANLAYALMALAFTLLVSGIVYALILKSRKPEVYTRIGRQVI
ncbi:APC family permease [Pseudomonas putida]